MWLLIGWHSSPLSRTRATAMAPPRRHRHRVLHPLLRCRLLLPPLPPPPLPPPPPPPPPLPPPPAMTPQRPALNEPANPDACIQTSAGQSVSKIHLGSVPLHLLNAPLHRHDSFFPTLCRLNALCKTRPPPACLTSGGRRLVTSPNTSPRCSRKTFMTLLSLQRPRPPTSRWP